LIPGVSLALRSLELPLVTPGIRWSLGAGSESFTVLKARHMVKNNMSIDYDKVSRIYDTSRAANTETIEKLVELLHIGSDSVVLDMGCGTGNYAAALQRVAKMVIGVDSSTGMIEHARAKFPELPLICGDVTSLPFGSEAFDGAFAIQVLHHVEEKEVFLTEAYRVIRKGTFLVIDSCSHRQMRTFWDYHYFPKGLEVDIARIPDAEEIASLLERTGFSNVGIEISYTNISAEHEKPKRYLDKNYRDGMSTFCLLSDEDIESGCEKLREDIESGAIESIIRQFQAKESVVGGSTIIYGRKASPL
jgi:SAM-dependent methyltransferase